MLNDEYSELRSSVEISLKNLFKFSGSGCPRLQNDRKKS